MLFNSGHFLIFFPIVLIVYFWAPKKYRWLILLVASYYFYMAWKAIYISLILISTVLDYFVGLAMSQEDDKRNRKILLFISLLVNLGLLGVFKYFNFFADNFNVLLGSLNLDYLIPASGLILPMGISFYTFQTMAYTIDVYNRKIEAEKHFGYFALYVSYFPQLVAGPIERAQNLLHQFKLEFRFEYERVVSGLKQMLWGFFKKMVIADRVAVLVEAAYSNPEACDGGTLLLATLLFTFQIYCDFSGYSDIAIGASRILGIKLMDNFRTPYLSRNVSEFWSRWHISLSTWFRDYLYIPLGGNRVVKWRWYYNLLIVFLVSGFWHGANWTFIAWGALHGIYLILALIFKEQKAQFSAKMNKWGLKRINTWTSIILTFVLVVIAWIYFRAENISDAHLILSKISSFDFNLVALESFIIDNGRVKALGILIIVAIFIFIDPFMDALIKNKRKVSSLSSYLIYSFLTVTILIAGNFGKVDFIYFQF
ncbi:MAG: MBOAT family O-acyltransferase [Bacteroidota bacterium]